MAVKKRKKTSKKLRKGRLARRPLKWRSKKKRKDGDEQTGNPGPRVEW
jgi:hypothetical protein